MEYGFPTAFDTDGVVTFIEGTMPSDPDDACVGDQLADLELSADAFGAPSAGAAVAAAISPDVDVNESGTPGYWVMHKTGDTDIDSPALSTDRRLMGTLTLTGDGGDMTANTVTWVGGGTASISAFTYNESP
jgi:hypothetical protein